MKTRLLFFSLSFSLVSLAQTPTDALRGPQNVLPDGVIDGVVASDEIPVLSPVEYEHVRLADLAQSWRVFSRIDAREKVNVKLFYPYDYFMDDWGFPNTRNEMSNGWVRHQERWSLWTIIMTHAMLGDLTLYNVFSDETPLIEDGYQLKYPIKRVTSDDFFNNSAYRKKVSRMLSVGTKGLPMKVFLAETQISVNLLKSGKSFDFWYDSLLNDPNVPRTSQGIPDYEELTRKDTAYLRFAWNSANDGEELFEKDVIKPISSQSITAFNIKEDWFFDKERSVLDKRIIAIAPVARIKYDPSTNDPMNVDDREPFNRYKDLVTVNARGDLEADGKEYTEEFKEVELFWLYFPELRYVLMNYFVYNEQNDANRMSFDHLFWKRLFSARIYRKSDQYDRNVEDYRYGVDALYEAEKFKESMRTWEADLWHY